MNITSNPFCPRKSSRRTVLPLTTSGSAKSGAVMPNSNIVDSVKAITPLHKFHRVITHLLADSLNLQTNSASRTAAVANPAKLEQPRLPSRHIHAEVLIRKPRSYPTSRCTIQKPDLDQEWLIDLLKRILFLGHRRPQR